MGRTVLISAVVGMGILIVLGITLLVYGLIQKVDNPDFKFIDLSGSDTAIEAPAQEVQVPLADSTPIAPVKNSAEPRAKSLQPSVLGDLNISIPTGYKLVDVDVSDNRLIMQLNNQDAKSQVLIFDLNNGAKIGSFKLQADE